MSSRWTRHRSLRLRSCGQTQPCSDCSAIIFCYLLFDFFFFRVESKPNDVHSNREAKTNVNNNKRETEIIRNIVQTVRERRRRLSSADNRRRRQTLRRRKNNIQTTLNEVPLIASITSTADVEAHSRSVRATNGRRRCVRHLTTTKKRI
jgi:hypothetical protein